MTLRTSLSACSAALFAALGLVPFTACGGSTTGDSRGGLGYMPCRNPAPLLGPSGEDTGYVTCDGSTIHRTAQVDCPSALPRAETCQSSYPYDSGVAPGCTQDSDCVESPHGYCAGVPGGIGCYCNYGCIRDADCASGQICLCGTPAGRCVASTCETDQSCGQGLCLSYEPMPGCPSISFACQTADDTCASDSDCTGSGGMCSLVNGVHACQGISCAIGRPFLVEGKTRLASLERRSDWVSSATPDLAGLSVPARATLGARWAEIGLMEHASIAAFARFALELLSLGAPPELVARTQEAMRDETLHARDAFALASAYTGAPIGPGALGLEGALGSRTPLDIVSTAILEGCIGETVAAVEAAEALARATDPAVRSVLGRVAEDEARHAELAWQFVKWALDRGPEALRRAAAAELERVIRCEVERCRGARALAEGADPSLSAHGVLDAGTRAEIRRQVLTEIIDPCARALMAAAPRTEVAESLAVG